MKKEKGDTFKSTPWKSLDEYFQLGRQYRLWGMDLKKAVLQDLKRKNIGIPKFKGKEIYERQIR